MLVKGVIADQTGFCGWMMGDILYYQIHAYNARCTHCRPINNDVLPHSKTTILASEPFGCIFRPFWMAADGWIYISHRPNAASTFIILSMANVRFWRLNDTGDLLCWQFKIYIDACHRVGTLLGYFAFTNVPWRSRGICTCTVARATSVMEVASRMRRNAQRSGPVVRTTESRTPEVRMYRFRSCEQGLREYITYVTLSPINWNLKSCEQCEVHQGPRVSRWTPCLPDKRKFLSGCMTNLPRRCACWLEAGPTPPTWNESYGHEEDNNPLPVDVETVWVSHCWCHSQKPNNVY